MKIGFIGSGKVGTTFGIYLRDKNIEVAGYYDKDQSRKMDSASLVGGTGYESLQELVFNCDIIGITTNDDNIGTVAEEILSLANDKKLNIENKEFFHMSGSLGISVLEKLSKNCLTIHPLQAFSNIEKAVSDFQGTVLTVTGNMDTSMGRMVKTFKNQIIEIKDSDKTMYHAAACVASNYLVTVIDTAVNMLKEAGFTEEIATKALLPLIKATVTNVENMGCTRALTGPIARGDVETVKSHLNVLANSDVLEVYKLLGEKTVEVARRDELKDKAKLKSLMDDITGEVHDER